MNQYGDRGHGAGVVLDPETARTCEARLRRLHDAWIVHGRAQQTPAKWNRELWLRTLPEHVALFRALPRLVGRQDVQEVFRKTWTQNQAERAFVAAMVWGYGPANYGPYRTSRVLANPSAVYRLHRAARILRKEGPLAGFTAMANPADCRIDRLGPAFGTKFLFFASADSVTAPVLDALVVGWIERQSGGHIKLGKLTWNPSMYERYLRLIGGWSAALRETVADTEFLIFADAASSTRGTSLATWAEDWVPVDG